MIRWLASKMRGHDLDDILSFVLGTVGLAFLGALAVIGVASAAMAQPVHTTVGLVVLVVMAGIFTLAYRQSRSD